MKARNWLYLSLLNERWKLWLMYCSVWPSCSGLRCVTIQTHFFLHFVRNYRSGRWGGRNGFSDSRSKLAEVVRVARLESRQTGTPEARREPALGRLRQTGAGSGESPAPERVSRSCHLPERAGMCRANPPVLQFRGGMYDLCGRGTSGQGERPDKWSIWWVSGKELNAIPV